MTLLVSRAGAVLHLGFSGGDAIDFANAHTLKADAVAAIGEAPDVVVDLSTIEFLDSAGVGMLVALFKHSRQRGGRARFCGLSPGVRAVLEIIRLHQIFEIYDDVEAAVGS